MNAQMEARLNAKYGAFWVTRYSADKMRGVGIGKPLPTIRQALDKAARLEAGKRYAGQMLFIDTQP